MSTACRRIAILGAESSGKSTLAAALAAHYGSVWVPEYLREFVDHRQRVPLEVEQAELARTQRAREDAAARTAHGLLFCDTTPLMTALYSRHCFGRADPAVEALAGHERYALTVVTQPDIPWVADGLQRDSEAARQAIHALLLRMLDERAIAFTLVGGTQAQRLLQMQTLIDVLD